jgi:alkanesulfonate monooxygenase SsuD/methylene tetrahydromethanopterin reductase-like flavin-dependent oxidoreductase (luciferase family)
VRLGIVVDVEAAWAAQRDLARQADDLGFDLLWVEADDAIIASALAGVTSSVRVGLRLRTGVNPVLLAEEAAVADLVLGGRLVLALAAGPGGGEELDETVEVVLSGLAPRPFAHDGPQWKIPANFPTNVETEHRVLVTPTPAQIELPVWVTGPGGPAVATRLGLAYAGTADESTDDLEAVWAGIDAALGPASARLRRPAVRPLADELDVAATVASLRAEQQAWGLDVAILHAPAAALETIAREIRPRVQLDSLPRGLDEFWHRLHHERI